MSDRSQAPVGYRRVMTTTTPPPAGADEPQDPAVDPADAGFPTSPDLDDDNTVYTDPGANDEESGGAGLG